MRTITVHQEKGFFVLLAALLLVAAGACSSGEPQPPNLLILVSDALRADVLGCCGGAARTPNTARLARRGALFERCYSTTPWTWPSAVSMFTGNHPDAYHATVEHLFPETHMAYDASSSLRHAVQFALFHHIP